MAVSLEQYEKALDSLAKALQEDKNDIVRDASIQRFEFCIELAWKTAKKKMGTNATAPKTIIREMAQASLIDDPNLWFQFLEARNLSSHTYNEELAERVYAEAKNFLSYGQKLAKKLIDF